MSTPTVSPETLRDLLDYDPKTGALTWRKRPSSMFSSESAKNAWNARHAGKKAGSLHSKGYLSTQIFCRRYFIHRIVFAIHNGRWPKDQIDHINGVRTDNRIENLRDVSNSENMQNQRAATKSNKTSGLLGVSWHKACGKWRAQIRVDGKSTEIGFYADKHEAHDAYLRAKRDMHKAYSIGECSGRMEAIRGLSR